MLTKRLLPLTGLLSLFALIAGSIQSRAAEDHPGCVWEVAGKANTVYLAGSMHLLTEKDYPLPQPYDDAYKKSEKIWFEAPPDKINDPAIALQVMQMAMYTEPGQSLKTELSPETYQALVKGLQGHQLFALMPDVDKIRPGFLAIMLGQLELMEMGARPDLGLDMHLYQRAVADRKETGGLETWDFQMKLLNQFNKEENDKMVRYTLDNLGKTKEFFEKLVERWKKGDAEGVAAAMNEGLEDFPELAEVLLIDRNRSWIEKIEPMLSEEDKDVMVVVGTGHLVGKDSVIELLEKKGYTVRQLRIAAEPVPAQ
ncbi:MAG TPA: TraB/GumN family protein [Verrucomicrobiales bacterium]|nr:TraB/GumN family protein [Verrucomicrobiales bacterium]